MKKNNKGFVLIETLVVTVFVMAIFSVIYINFYPLIGEYERREFYDDVDSKYGCYWMKMFIQSSDYDFFRLGGPADIIKNSKFIEFTCDQLAEGRRNICSEMWNRLDVKKVIITDYNLAEFKAKAQNGITGFSDGFMYYIDNLPDYKVGSYNGATYRVLVEFERTMSNVEGSDHEIYYTYANMEVVKSKFRT